MRDFFTTFDAARLCQVSPGSIVRWIHEGKLRASFTAGGHHRIRREDLRRLLDTLKMPIPDELTDSARADKTSQGPVKILIVDDEDGVRNMLKRFFERDFPDMIVKEAKGGFEAGWMAHGFEPDVMILDLMMPHFDGFGVCKLLRQSDHLKRTRIIAVTGLGSSAQERILSAGANDFLPKPFKWQTLREKVLVQLSELGNGGKGSKS